MSSVDRKPPSVLAVSIAAVLSVTVGAVLAGLHLASLPVEVVRTVPKEKAAKRYYVLGAAASTAGKSWEAKEEALSRGHAGEVGVSEAELNGWVEDKFAVAKVPADQKGQTAMILGGVPNFRTDGSELCIGLVNTVTFFGSEAPLVLQARGAFEKRGSGWRFVAREAKLGALPLHKVPVLLSLVADKFAPTPPSALVEKVLRDARAIAVRDGALLIDLP